MTLTADVPAILRGPAHPDRFRIQVGRYGDRWYHDPLPGCEIAPATDEQFPSMSLVKNAWPKFLNKWIADSVAQRAVDDWDALSQLDGQARFAVLASSANSKRDDAAARGTTIHDLIERIAMGQPVDDVWDAAVAPFVPVVRKMLADLQPEWLFSEAVVISRSHRFGGTGDAAWWLRDLGVCMVDFKTRKEHRCYDDEGIQVAGYANGDYMIVDRDGNPCRARLPEFDRGLIITITPDSYELHPIDLANGLEAFVTLRRFWDVQQARNIVGKPVFVAAVNGNGTAPNDDGGMRSEHARQRAVKLAELDAAIAWPAGVPTFRQARESGHQFTVGDLELIEAALTEAEAATETPPSNEPAVTVANEDSAARAEHARRRLEKLIELGDVAIAWPIGVPTFREVRESGHRYSPDELDAIDRALSQAEAAVDAPFSDDMPKPSPERIVAMSNRAKALPADLLAQLDKASKAARIPNLHGVLVTVKHLDDLERILAPLEAQAAERSVAAVDAFGDFAGDDEVTQAICTLLGLQNPGQATDDQLRRVEAIVAALDESTLELGYTDEGRAYLTIGDKAEQAVVAAGGGNRPKALVFVKDVADANGFKRPRSIGAATSEPLLVALVCAAAKESGATQDLTSADRALEERSNTQ